MQLQGYKGNRSEEIKEREVVEGNERGKGGKGIHGRGSGRTNRRTWLT